MKAVILCGGLGSRLSEETKIIPKPLVKIGSIPIIEHIIRFYRYYGIEEFILSTVNGSFIGEYLTSFPSTNLTTGPYLATVANISQSL